MNDAIAHDLDTIAQQARAVLRRARLRLTLKRALAAALAASAAVLLVHTAMLAAAALGVGLPVLPPVAALAAAAGLGLGYVGWRVATVDRRVPRSVALAAVDAELGLSDRLVTAAEFLAKPARGPFEEAAVLDAATVTGQALATELAEPATGVGLGVRGKLHAAAAVVLIVVAFVWQPVGRHAANGPEPGERLAVAAVTGDERKPAERATESLAEPRVRDEFVAPETAPSRARKPGKRESRGADLSDDAKQALGATGRGQSADAAQSNGTSNARGTPSGQSQESLGGKRSAKKAKKKPAKRSRPAEPFAAKEEENSGATVGRGLASGSTRSPAASQWRSRDQVTSEEEEELDEDEEVDDESDDQEARGGVQPHLRDRRPPVNRDLSISFGSGKPPPDANGRGGPGPQKKSRGVASLVLGVPIPDHIKGRPNPGKTKITQERVEPEVEEAAAVRAGVRTPRTGPIGAVPRPELSLWMRDVVRAYLERIRPRRRKQ